MKKILNVLLISVLCLNVVGCQKEITSEDYNLANKQLKISQDLKDKNIRYKALISRTFYDGSLTENDIINVISGYYDLEEKLNKIDIDFLNKYIEKLESNDEGTSIEEGIIDNYNEISKDMESYKRIVDILNKEDPTMDDILKLKSIARNLNDN